MLAIEVQVGRTGTLTPVARLKPVFVGGVTVTTRRCITRTSCAARTSGWRHGGRAPRGRRDPRDRAACARSGRGEPQTASRCRAAVPNAARRSVRVAGEAATRCTGGLYCKAQRKQTLLHFAAPPRDGYRGPGREDRRPAGRARAGAQPGRPLWLDVDTLAGLERMAEKSAENLKRSIDAARSAELHRFIYALGIPGVGEEVAKILARHFGTLEAFRAADWPGLRQTRKRFARTMRAASGAASRCWTCRSRASARSSMDSIEKFLARAAQSRCHRPAGGRGQDFRDVETGRRSGQ